MPFPRLLCPACLLLVIADPAPAQVHWVYQGEQLSQMTANAHANAFLSGGGPNPQDSAQSQVSLQPNFPIGADTYDYGNEARAVAISSSGGLCSASALSVTGVRGLGTNVIEVYYRVSTLDDASFPDFGYESASAAVLNILYHLELGGAAPGEAYHVTCDYEFFGNAATQADAAFDDTAQATSHAILLNGQVGSHPEPYNLTYFSHIPPTGTGGTVTGSIASAARPDVLSPVPAPPLYFIGIDNTMAGDVMTSPGLNGTSQDLCGAEFEARLTFTIGGICPKPTIANHPANAQVCTGASASFTVDAPAPGNTFQWLIADPFNPGSFHPVFDGPIFTQGGQEIGTLSGTATPNLMLATSIPGPFITQPMRCMVSNFCNAALTDPAVITILPPNHPNCPACDSIDFNHDTLFPDTTDIDDFLSVFSGGPCSNDPNCGDIDFNNDGLFPDTLDIDALLSVFSGGPCL